MEMQVLDEDSGIPMPPELLQEMALREKEFLTRKQQEMQTRRAVSDDGKTTVRILDRWKDPVPRCIFEALREAEERVLMARHEKSPRPRPSPVKSVEESARVNSAEAEHGGASAETEQVGLLAEGCVVSSDVMEDGNTKRTSKDAKRIESAEKSLSSCGELKIKKRSREAMTKKVSSLDPPRTCLEWLTGERGKKKAKVATEMKTVSSSGKIPNFAPKPSGQKLKAAPVQTPIDSKDPYLKRQWPPELRRRVYIEHMPGPKSLKMGQVLLLWLRPVSSRIQNSFTMAFILWMHERLKLPVFAVILLDPEFPGILHNTTDSRRRRCLEDIPGMMELSKSLQDSKIPFIGLYVPQKDIPSFFAQVTRKCKVHAIVTSDQLVFGPKKFVKALTKSIPCPLFLVDNDALVPTRYLPREILSTDAHWKSFMDAAEAMSAYELNGSKVLGQIQSNLNPELTAAIPSRWKQVNFGELENALDNEESDLKARLQLTESRGLEVLMSHCKEHFEEMTKRGTTCHVFAEILSYIVYGKLSALQVVKHLRVLRAYEPQSPIVDALFQRERRRYIAYRTLREALELNQASDSELVKFFKRESAEAPIPTWAHLIPERAYSELNAALEDEHHPDSQKKVFLPADIERGLTTDSFFNSIQENLVNRGTIIESVMGFWVQQIVAEFTDNPLHGLNVAVKLLQDYLPGSTSICDNIAHVLDQGFSRFNELQKHPVFGSIRLCTVSEEEREEFVRAQERRLGCGTAQQAQQ